MRLRHVAPCVDLGEHALESAFHPFLACETRSTRARFGGTLRRSWGLGSLPDALCGGQSAVHAMVDSLALGVLEAVGAHHAGLTQGLGALHQLTSVGGTLLGEEVVDEAAELRLGALSARLPGRRVEVKDELNKIWFGQGHDVA